MGKLIDLTDNVYGHLTVLGRGRTEPNSNHGTKVYWRCQCTCGAVKEIIGHVLRAGKVKSCGCQTAQLVSAAKLQHGHNRRGGMSGTYSTWANMIQRCSDPNHKDWPYYGGRGITVCQRWRSFDNFLADMGNRPAGMTIERQDNDVGYERSNCVWADRQQQGRNRRNVR